MGEMVAVKGNKWLKYEGRNGRYEGQNCRVLREEIGGI